MEFFSGLDMSIDETAICVIDDKGAVHLQTVVATDPETIVQVLKPFLPKLRRVGHEAGSLSPWLYPELAALGSPAVCFETRHVRAGDVGAAQQDSVSRFVPDIQYYVTGITCQ